MDNPVFYVTDENGNLTRIGAVTQETAQQVVSILIDASTSRAGHGRDRPVRVIDVDEVKFAKYRDKGAKQFEPGDKFPSATEASLRLGLKHNQVGMDLAKARRTAEREADEKFGEGSSQKMKLRPTATVRGVSFQYESDYDSEAADDVRV